MALTKTKIRLSSFVLLIIDNDCQAFGFISKDNSPNRNGFLNKLIPNLVDLRKKRREEIEITLKDDFQRKDSESIYEAVNNVIDRVYFKDEMIAEKNSSVWLRPNRSARNTFDEIEESELKITCQDFSSYIRGLLNEYSCLPQYKRQSLAFAKEDQICRRAYETNQIMIFRYKGGRYRVCFYMMEFGFLYDQTNYVICLDTKTKEIRSFDLSFVENPILIKEKYRLDERAETRIQEYLEKNDFSDSHVEKIEDGKKNEE